MSMGRVVMLSPYCLGRALALPTSGSDVLRLHCNPYIWKRRDGSETAPRDFHAFHRRFQALETGQISKPGNPRGNARFRVSKSCIYGRARSICTWVSGGSLDPRGPSERRGVKRWHPDVMRHTIFQRRPSDFLGMPRHWDPTKARASGQVVRKQSGPNRRRTHGSLLGLVDNLSP